MNARTNTQEPEGHAASLPARGIVMLTKLSGALSAVLILIMLAIICYAIVQRYVLQTPLLWGDEVLGYLLVLFVMLGAADVLTQNEHIAMDVFSGRAAPKTARWLGIWSNLAVLAFAIVVGWSTWKSIRFAYSFGSYSVGHIEIATWIPQAPVLAGSLLVGLVALSRILTSLASRAPR